MGKAFVQRKNAIVRCRKPAKEMEIPAKLGLSEIGEDVFRKAKNLEKITIPGNIRVIGRNAFKNCTSLKTVVFQPAGQVIVCEGAFEGCVALRNIEHMNNIISIGERAFKDCICLDTSEINPYLIEFGKNCFEKCHHIRTIDIPLLHKVIPESAFADCDMLTDATMGQCIETVSEKAFCGCTSLRTAVYGDTLTEIGKRAFYSCYNLESVSMGCNTKKVKKEAFANCRMLKGVEFSKNNGKKRRHLHIGSGAFSGCYELRSVILPDCRVSFGFNVFKDCHIDPAMPLCIYIEGEKRKELLEKKFKGLIGDGLVKIVELDADGNVIEQIHVEDEKTEKAFEVRVVEAPKKLPDGDDAADVETDFDEDQLELILDEKSAAEVKEAMIEEEKMNSAQLSIDDEPDSSLKS